jgi:hypothetical protein
MAFQGQLGVVHQRGSAPLPGEPTARHLAPDDGEHLHVREFGRVDVGAQEPLARQGTG